MDDDKHLDTAQAAEFLTARGYRTAPATLTKLRSVGGGPEFALWGRHPIYTPPALLAWAAERVKPSNSSAA